MNYIMEEIPHTAAHLIMGDDDIFVESKKFRAAWTILIRDENHDDLYILAYNDEHQFQFMKSIQHIVQRADLYAIIQKYIIDELASH